MRRFSDLPIKHKLTLINVLTSTVALLLACSAIAVYEQVQDRRELVADLSSIAEIIAYNSASALSFTDADSAEQTLQALGARSHIAAACIYDRGGRVFATFPHGRNPADFAQPPAGPTELFTAGRLDLFRPIVASGERIGTIYLRADLLEIHERLLRYALIIGAVMLVAILIAYLVASRLQRVISAPVSDLVAVASRVASDRDYTIRAVKRGNDELGRLIDSFNDMLGQIQARDSALQSAHDSLEARVEERTAKLAEATAKLAYERDQLRALLDSIPDAIFFKDTQSRFVLVSRSKVRRAIDRVPDLRSRRAAAGLAPDVAEAELLTGMTDTAIFREEDARRAGDDEQRIVRTGEAMIGKLEKREYLDGVVVWALTSKMPWRDPDGRTIGTFGISTDVTSLKDAEAELERLHRELVSTSRQAGMAEVATGVLHNVGNVLNSVNVSATLVAEHVRHTKAVNVGKLAALFEQHKSDLPGFLTNDPRGKLIPAYLGTLGEMLAAEQETMAKELDQLRRNIEHIKEIVAMQQSYARVSGVIETVSLPEMVEDALRINAGSLARHNVDTSRDYQSRAVVTTDKHKVMQILINLVRNAKYACDESGRTDKRITVRTTSGDRGAQIAIVDNGIGIPAENLTRIFNHGFTTRTNGHGFGLHSGALAAKELGGSLNVRSEGAGQGATFILELPYTPGAPANEIPAR